MDLPSTSKQNNSTEDIEEREIRKRDEFFQKVADLLEPVVKDDEITVEELREVCYRYALKHDWVRSAVIDSVKNHLKVESAGKCQNNELENVGKSEENADESAGNDFEGDENYFSSAENDRQSAENVVKGAGDEIANPEVDLENNEHYFDSAEIPENDVEETRNEMKGAENFIEDEENDECIWNAYLLGIQCSATDLLKMKKSEDENISTLYGLLTRSDFGDSLRVPIPGKVEIEGRIICDVFDVILNLEESKVMKKSEIYDSYHEEIYEDVGSREPQPLPVPNVHYQAKKKPFAINFNPFSSFTAKSKNRNEFSSSSGKIPEPIEIPKIVPSDQEIKLKVNDRLEKFVRFFVKEFETKLASYVLLSNGEAMNEEDFEGSVSAKIGKILGKTIFGAIGGAAGAVLGWPGAKTGAELGSKVGEKVVEMINEKQQNKTVKNLEDLIDYYLREKSEFTKLLCEVGYDIFQSFEMQLMRVSSEKGVKSALHLLATDAVHRMMSFISQNRLEEGTTGDLHFLLIEGLKWGKSKRTFLNLKCRGYEITYESPNKNNNSNRNNSFKEIKWTSGCFYEKTGIVTFKNDERVFLKNKSEKSQTEKYGYRRLFRAENWAEMSALFQREINRFENYKYFLRAKDAKSKAKKIFGRLEDKSLDDERVKSILKESKEEMLEGIITLKGINRDFSDNLRRLSEFEENLKRLKIEEHVKKLETFFRNEEKNEAKIQELLDKINEMDKKLDKLCRFNEEKIINEENFDIIP